MRELSTGMDGGGGAYDDGGMVRRPSAWVAWTSTGLMTLLFAMAYMDRQIVSLMVKPISAEFGIGDFQISLLQGFAFALLYAVCGLPFGQAVDRYPRRYIIMAGVLIWSIAAMGCGLARTFNELLLARVLVGAGEAALAPACYSLLADLFPRRRLTFALAVFMVGGLFGAELSLAIGGTILEVAKDGLELPVLGMTPAWRVAFLLSAMPGIPIAFLALLIHEPARGRSGSLQKNWGDVFAFIAARRRFFFVQMAGFATVMALVYVRLAWTATFMMRTYGWSVAEVSYALATYGFLMGSFCLLLGGRIVDALFRRGMRDAHFRYYAAGGLLLATLGAVAHLAPTPQWYFIAMLLPFLPLSMGAIGASAVQLVTPPELRGRVSAVYLLVVSLVGMTVGPAAIGLMTDRLFVDPDKIGLAMMIAFGGGGLLVSALFLIGLPAMRDAVSKAGPHP